MHTLAHARVYLSWIQFISSIGWDDIQTFLDVVSEIITIISNIIIIIIKLTIWLDITHVSAWKDNPRDSVPWWIVQRMNSQFEIVVPYSRVLNPTPTDTHTHTHTYIHTHTHTRARAKLTIGFTPGNLEVYGGWGGEGGRTLRKPRFKAVNEANVNQR